jgi:hypothetical protein
VFCRNFHRGARIATNGVDGFTRVSYPKEDVMTIYRLLTAIVTPALLMVGALLSPAKARATGPGDSVEIAKLLADAKAEAVELKSDSEDLDSFAKSGLSWESHARKIEMIKDHVNKTGKLLAKLKDVEESGAPWQRTAIQRIEPLLKELAANTESTINYLNENQSKIHFPEFKDYVRANYELATDLETLIRDFVNYGEAKEKFERLGHKVEVSE